MRAPIQLERLWMAVILLFVWGCGGTGLPEGCRTIAELKAAGALPLEVLAVHPVINPLGRQFVVRVRNVSDADVEGFKATAILAGPTGSGKSAKLHPLGHLSLLDALAPGEEGELRWFAPDEQAVSARVVLQEVFYRAPSPVGGTLVYRFKNPRHDAEVSAASTLP